MNNFTPRAQQVLALSRKEADRFNHNYVGSEHLLLGLVRLGQGVAVNALQKQGLDLETLRIEVEKQVGSGPSKKISGNIPYTPRVKKILAMAAKEAKALNHSYVGTEHILLGILLESDGAAARVLKSMAIDVEHTRAEVLKELDPNFADRNPSAATNEEVNRVKNAMASLKQQQSDQEKQRERLRIPEGANLATALSIKPFLAPDETLLWCGVPKAKLRFGPQHLPFLFVLLPFLAFLLIPLFGALDSHPSDQTKPAPVTSGLTSSDQADGKPPHQQTLGEKIIMIVFFSLFFGGIAGTMIYSFGGRFLINRYNLSSTIYGVTDTRIIVITGKTKKTIRSHHLGTATDIRMEEWPDGLGTISFGPNPMWPYGTGHFYSQAALTLENIPDPSKVFQIVSQVRNPGSSPPASKP